jgi:tRNA modification GTPase
MIQSPVSNAYRVALVYGKGMDTIFALSTGNVPSGVAVIRLSGSRSRLALETLAGELPRPRELALRSIRGADGAIVDRGLICRFDAPRSFTGEDCGEIHLHGGPAVVRAVLRMLAEISGLRMAEAGEFSRRAFENGKLDLTSVEGLSDLIAAETEMQRSLAFSQYDGALRRQAEGWRGEIVRLRAMVEALLDFPDEEDVAESAPESVWEDTRHLATSIGRLVEGASAGEIVREGFQIVLMGRPNAGKSSLLNALARRDVAIVTPEAGTTRDILEVRLDLGGCPVVLVDTAGIRETAGVVEMEGVRRARLRSQTANLVLWLTPIGELEEVPQVEGSAPVLVLRSKDDAGDFGENGVSVRREESLSALEQRLQEIVLESVGQIRDGTVTRERQRQLLETAQISLSEAAAQGQDAELAAEHLRRAGEALGRLTGRIDVEDLLDVLFSEFCIGK